MVMSHLQREVESTTEATYSLYQISSTTVGMSSVVQPLLGASREPYLEHLRA